ncbi:ABC transporter ATP-binding protein [Vibrio breoganii]|uniref:ABC transporter ATP-binding protein n=1 Tax=Vibrio breoganii TaxID=553239 RepID=A0AAN0XU40_9VIBR|nr:ATP-binding cassette domain-containing protein [Vibrio breoganii]ANO32544.1 ABC transporter ATP-binding protein [Vibrio breoganii]
MNSNLPLLEVSNLTISDSRRTIFKDLSFAINSGQTLAVMGPSGIGKSMLSKAIAGFTPADIVVSGSIKVAGVEVAQLPLLARKASQRPAVIFQDALQALNPLAKVGTQLSLALSSRSTKASTQQLQHITELLQSLGFDYPKETLASYPSQLSGGQRQRICIAIALLGDASVLIADEPTSALDPVSENEILRLYRQAIKQDKLAGFLITHDLQAALACDKLLVIDDGKMIAYGQPYQALHESEHRFCSQVRELMA